MADLTTETASFKSFPAFVLSSESAITLNVLPSVFEALGGNAANGVMEVVYEVIPFSADAVYASATPPAAGQNQPHFPALYAPWNSFLRRLRLL